MQPPLQNLIEESHYRINLRLFTAVCLALFLLIPKYVIRAELSPTPTPTITNINQPSSAASPTITPSVTASPPISEGFDLTILPSATITPTITQTPSLTPTYSPLFLPVILRQPTPTQPVFVTPERVLFCDRLSSPLGIPDNDIAGVNRAMDIPDNRTIADLDVTLNIPHNRVGDLIIRLTHEEDGKSINLIDRPGYPASSSGCTQDNIRTILDDEISSSVEGKCAYSPAAISGIYIPHQALNIFDGDHISGSWTLNVSDNSSGATGEIRKWCLVAMISEYPPPPTPTPTVPPLPSKKILSGVSGKDQSLPLDCESRSAVDWARYFGFNIGELSFYSNLPHSDNPDKGFVGSVYGAWGQIPPDPYGVHAEPVAELLRDYGVTAYAHRPLSWSELKTEIAAGRPVITWIIGSIYNGIPVYYTPSDGLYTIVARYEHTVIVTGYTSSKVYYLNGDTIYTRSTEQFLDSWSALGNMAITAKQ
jgi:subtilisin-like proprotein convertase family protein/uncharacterized protein YvpB